MAQQKAEHCISSPRRSSNLDNSFLRYGRQLVGQHCGAQLIVAGGARLMAPAYSQAPHSERTFKAAMWEKAWPSWRSKANGMIDDLLSWTTALKTAREATK